jgi:arginase
MPFSGPPDLTRIVEIIGVPVDVGASRRGARLGPQAIRAAGLVGRIESLGYRVRDAGDVASQERAAAAGSAGAGEPHSLDVLRTASASLADAIERSLRSDALPIVLGGDHSLAIGALAGAARVKGLQGLIWIDAHADLNTPATSPTGNLHGMPVAAALGELHALFDTPTFPTPSIDAARTVFVGLRDLDPGEKRAILMRGMTAFTMSDIDRIGMAKVMERAIEIAAKGPASLHLSFDIDALDPSSAPGTGTPVPGGLTYREGHLAMEIVAESGAAHSVELVEVNPALDDGVTTARVAMELICSALGKSIL